MGFSPYFNSKIVDVVLNTAFGKISSPRIKLMTLLLPALVSPKENRIFKHKAEINICFSA